MDLLKIYSSVSPKVEKKALFKGSFIAGIGVLLLAFSGSFIKEPLLKIWGLPILILSASLITYGLLPYRRLMRLQRKPNEIILSEELLQYVENNKRQITLPLSLIKKASYLEDKDDYGIGIWLKSAEYSEKIIVHNPSFDLQKKVNQSEKRWKCDLFFPYFSRRSFSRIGFIGEGGEDS